MSHYLTSIPEGCLCSYTEQRDPAEPHLPSVLEAEPNPECPVHFPPAERDEVKYPDVTADQLRLIRTYGHLFTNTGGNGPADLLQDLQRPGTDDRPNRLMLVNTPRFCLAVGIQSQVGLLGRLEAGGLLVSAVPL